MSDETARLGLELIEPGQSQKELSHNEALTRLDLLVQPTALEFARDTPPMAPVAGDCWVVGPDPTGDWADRTDALAMWTEGGWRFAEPFEGFVVWIADEGMQARFSAESWTLGSVRGATLAIDGVQVVGPQQDAIDDIFGGESVDIEARAAVAAILETLRSHGLIAS